MLSERCRCRDYWCGPPSNLPRYCPFSVRQNNDGFGMRGPSVTAHGVPASARLKSGQTPVSVADARFSNSTAKIALITAHILSGMSFIAP